MRRFLTVFSAAMTISLAPPAIAEPAPLGVNAEPQRGVAIAEVDRIARDWVASGHAPGMAIAVMRDGKIVFSKAYGLAELENQIPVRTDTVFRIGSVSKQFAAAAILKLAEQGRLSLDDTLSQYYPEITRGDEVTIRQMLNHTSGLHNYIEVGPDPRAMLPLMMDYTTDEFARHIARQDPLYDFAPGAAYHYSNAGYFLAGGIVEKVSGQTLGAYFREQLFKPAGMMQTDIDGDGAIVPLRASGYEVIKKGGGSYRTANYVSLTVAGAAGALRSTTDDLMKWQDALLSGRIIAPAFLKEMLAPGRLNDGRLASSAPFPAPTNPLPAAARQDYGMGLNVGAVGGHRRISHGGNIFGFNSALNSFPDDGIAWVALTNAGTGVSGLSGKIDAAVLGLTANDDSGLPD